MEEKNLKPFDLEKAKAGAKVVTRDGRNVRIICFDRGHKTDHIVALIDYNKDGETTEEVVTLTDQGTFYDNGKENGYDLFIAPTIVEKWVNVYKNENGYYYGYYYDSELEALNYKDDNECIATTKITWEE